MNRRDRRRAEGAPPTRAFVVAAQSRSYDSKAAPQMGCAKPVRATADMQRGSAEGFT